MLLWEEKIIFNLLRWQVSFYTPFMLEAVKFTGSWNQIYRLFAKKITAKHTLKSENLHSLRE